jgi:hypothetical protein
MFGGGRQSAVIGSPISASRGVEPGHLVLTERDGGDIQPQVSHLTWSSENGVDEAWRKTANTPLKLAANIAGVSVATMYSLHHRGGPELRRIAGVTLAPTATLAALVDGAEKWTPSHMGEAARKASQAVSTRRHSWLAVSIGMAGARYCSQCLRLTMRPRI